MSNLARYSGVTIAPLIGIVLFLNACSGSSDGTITTGTTNSSSSVNPVQVTLSGDVDDGPVTQSNVSIQTADNETIWTGTSDGQAVYSANISVIPADYPLVLTATGGINLVTGISPEFELRSASLGVAHNVGNINTFSTIIHATANAQASGLNEAGILSATQVVLQELNFGLDTNRILDPATTPVQNSNIANLVRSSEAIAEMIRRSRAALLAANVSQSADELIAILGADLTDGFIDGAGGNADARVAATATIVSAQVLVETMMNELRVGGVDATSRIDTAIAAIRPGASLRTSDLKVPHDMIMQAGIAIAAAYALSPSEDLGHLLDALFAMPDGVSGTTAKALLPANAVSILDGSIAIVATGTEIEHELVNDSVRQSIGPASTDHFPPIISLVGAAALSLAIGDPYVEPGATAIDNRDGDISASITIDNGSISTANVGRYSVTYNVSDSANNAAEELVRIVNVFDPGVPDTTAPVITLVGNNPLTVYFGDTYVEPGAIAADDVDGDLTGSISIDSGAVNTASSGNYTVTYNVSDAAGNAASQTARTVVVRSADDTGIPPWEAVLGEMVGYAAHAGVTGGAGKPLLTVTNLNNSGSGSLRQAVADARAGGAWIRFANGLTGTIKLGSSINLVRDVTIDGRGANVTVQGPGEAYSTFNARRGDQNWILMYIKLDGPVGANNDLLNVQNRDTDDPSAPDLTEAFWLFHVSFSHSEDELFSVRRSRGNYTVQNCFFDQPTGSGYGMLMHNSASLGQWDQIVQKSTWTRNYWFSIRDRAPRISVPAHAHMFNNYWDDWDFEVVHAVSRQGALIAQALLENNVADATGDRDVLAGANESGMQSGEIRATGNLMLSGAGIHERNPVNVFAPPYSYSLAPATLPLRDEVISDAGWQNVPFPN